MTIDPVRQYIRKGNKRVDGWLGRADSEIIRTLMVAQTKSGLAGAVAEIGVHHGKSFILLALCNSGNKSYAIDVFGQQDLNIDHSGKGDKSIFLENLADFGIDHENVVIDARSSSEVRPDDILNSVGPVRMFHVDGGHHLGAILNDIDLAERSICEGGIIAVDDVFRPEWPEVSIGIFQHIHSGDSDLVAFACGYNKTYLCHPHHAATYRKALAQNAFLAMYLTRRYRIEADEIMIYQRYPLPEWRLKMRVFYYLSIYHPEFGHWFWRRFIKRR